MTPEQLRILKQTQQFNDIELKQLQKGKASISLQNKAENQIEAYTKWLEAPIPRGEVLQMFLSLPTFKQWQEQVMIPTIMHIVEDELMHNVKEVDAAIKKFKEN